MNVNVLLYDDFDLMDMSLPVGVFGKRPDIFHMNYVSLSGDIINSTQGTKIWTELAEETEWRDILLIPGGRGARRLIRQDETYVQLLKKAVDQVNCCLLVGSGAALLAQTGVLYHRNVADFAMAENWKRMFTAGIHWISDEKWVADGKFYSTSQSLYALDMTLSMIADLLDTDMAEEIARGMDHHWDMDEAGYF